MRRRHGAQAGRVRAVATPVLGRAVVNEQVPAAGYAVRNGKVIMRQNYINHVALVIDRSGSMKELSANVVQVVDQQIEFLAKRSKELDQETRVTVYLFDSAIECIVYDKDVLRMPSLKGLYQTGGLTALLDATAKALDDLGKTPELYGDHAFLAYVITDGEENQSATRPTALAQRLRALPENWTVAAFVPNQRGKAQAVAYGFPADNVAIWETTSAGVRDVGKTITQATNSYMTSRTLGVRGSRNLFALNTNVAKADVATLPKLHPGQYRLANIEASDVGPIAPFVERLTKRAYKLGEAFYQLSKPEKVQPTKAVALFDRKSRNVYTGAEARKLLGLPNDHEVKVAPAALPDFDIFVQSGSVNRKLVAGTKLLLLS